jgi:uncharacterized protein YkwD
MGKCDVIGCEGDAGLPYTCNECGGQFCSEHRLPENHNCQALKTKSSDGKLFSTSLQDKTEGENQGITDRLREKAKGETPGPMDRSDHTIGISDSKKTTQSGSDKSKSSSPEPDSLAERSSTSSTSNYASNRLILTTASSILRKLAVLGLILGVIVGVAFLAGGGSIPSPDQASGAVGAALNETEEFVSSYFSQPNQTAESQPAGSEFNRENVEYLIHEHINEVRAERDLSRLSFDTGLREIARYHSEDMASSGYFAHTSPDGESMGDRYQKFGYQCQVSSGGNQYTTGGENLAKTYYQARISLQNGSTVYYDSPGELAQGVVQQWMNSEGHRENILKPYWENEGIGVTITEEDGATAVYVTQNFC